MTGGPAANVGAGVDAGAAIGTSACAGAGADAGASCRAMAAPAEDEDVNLCVFCMQQPRDATIVHGDSGHVCCCIACATLLKGRGKPCPICRAPISMVIRHYVTS